MPSFISQKITDASGTYDICYTSINFMPEQSCVKIEGIKRFYDENENLYHAEAFSRIDRNTDEVKAARYVYGEEELEEYKVDDQTLEIIEPDDTIQVVVKEANPKFDNWCLSLEPILNDKL